MVFPVRFGELVERDQEHHYKTKQRGGFVTFQSLIHFLPNVSNSCKVSRLLLQSQLAAETKNSQLFVAEQNRGVVPVWAIVL